MILKENEPGPYFVDRDCIACDTCTTIAPHQFKLSKNQMFAYVYCQPTNETEQKQTLSAIKQCPVDAIGKQ